MLTSHSAHTTLINWLAVKPPKSQNSDRVKAPKSEYPTGINSRNLIPPKSQFTERLFIRCSENPKSYSPELSLLRRTVLPKVPSPGQSRKSHCSEFLFLRCRSYTDIGVLLTNERQIIISIITKFYVELLIEL